MARSELAQSLDGQRPDGGIDPAAGRYVETVGWSPQAGIVLVCEHAGRLVPPHLGDLGLPPAEFERHIGWDIGAGAVTRRMAAALSASAVLNTCSRLVIDCNRPVTAPDAFPVISDGTRVPGNAEMSDSDRAWRIATIHAPFHAAVADRIAAPGVRAVFSIHSFTPEMKGIARPWDIGLLFRKDQRTPHLLAAALHNGDPGLRIGLNEPYQIDDQSDWFVPVHGEGSGLPHALIEIRNDHIRDHAGIERIATLLSGAVTRTMEDL